MTLDKFFQDAAENGIIDFRLRTTIDEDSVAFYIHPLGKDGETGDFITSGTTVIFAERLKST